ncbi:hypothetical protein [Pseudohongiella spirulinae]|uniref:Uncharacterized protein n=1 Tax=Pseudohongiella spirulinae TaxID=1249552 RepID=A0A0S2KG82_9GAMM|nr:hypothetical protein [Pseudohongiella spirulinae]ALO47329.1 hypothetical protein PS2015_2697 [Pseudohongiella spirulinae]
MNSVKKSDGFTLATAAAALMMSGTAMAAFDTLDNNPDNPVKIAVCQDVDSANFVAISTGNENFSSVMCQVLGGSQAKALSAKPDTDLAADAVKVAYCNDVFTCAGQNTCHGIGFVGVYSDSDELSASLCEKLGGTVLSSL